MRLLRVKLSHVALCWLIFLVGAAWLLPPLDSHMPTNAALRALILACCTVLVVATCMGAMRYFTDAWGKAAAVPDRAAYITWISLEGLAAVVLLAVVLVIAWNTYAVRAAIKWFVRSHDYKAQVLAQPTYASGSLKHIEWDGWGWAGQDTTVYLVFDPTDSLTAAATRNEAGKPHGLPCEVARVVRLESHWYTVQMYTNADCWR